VLQFGLSSFLPERLGLLLELGGPREFVPLVEAPLRKARIVIGARLLELHHRRAAAHQDVERLPEAGRALSRAEPGACQRLLQIVLETP
jgi:hypothetical protein